MDGKYKLLATLTLFGLTTTVTAQAGSSCVTPNGETAKCISIYSCQLLYNAVSTNDSEVIKFLQQSQCGYSSAPLVCCGTQAKYVQKSDTNGNNLLPGNDECGIQITDKILNGKTAGLREFPWMALLRYRNASGFESNSCGGTLISDKYVITAAHCLTGAIPPTAGQLVSVRLGEWNTQTHPDCIQSKGFNLCSDDPINVKVTQEIPHPKYVVSSRDRLHDIGLVRLERSVKYTDYVRPICLPSPTEKAGVGDELTVVGWGLTEAGVFSPTKQKLSVPISEPSQCAATFRIKGVNLKDSQLCAGGEKDKDSCKGDSGGPLLNQRSSGQFFIEGVVSFGAKCGTAGWPGIYTRITSYLTWINQNMRP